MFVCFFLQYVDSQLLSLFIASHGQLVLFHALDCSHCKPLSPRAVTDRQTEETVKANRYFLLGILPSE